MLLAPLLAAAIVAAATPIPGAVPERAQAYFNYCLALQAISRHDLPEAIGWMENAVRDDPASIDLAVELAQLHLDLNDPERAARVAQQAVERDRASSPAWRTLAAARGSIADRDGTPEAREAARAALAGLIESAPDDAGALLQMARIELSRGKPEVALESLRQLLKAAPDSEEGLVLASHTLGRLKKHDEAVSLLLDAVAKAPDSSALRIALAEAHEASGDLEEAMLVASKLSSMRVDPVRVSFLMARLSARAGHHSEAYEHWTRIGALLETREPPVSAADRAEVVARRTESLLDAGRSAESATLAAEAQQRFPAEPRFTMRRAEALLMLGKSDEALTVLAPALEPGSDPGLRRMASDAFLSAGARRERSGELRQAEKLLRKSIEILDTNGPALNYLGYMFADRGERLDEAIDLIQRAVAQDPDNGAFLDSLGWAHFRRHEFPEAEAALVKASGLVDEEPDIHEHLGELYLAMGRYEAAIQSLQRAIDGGAQDPEALRKRIATARKSAASAP